jgi:hypothetical protein
VTSQIAWLPTVPTWAWPLLGVLLFAAVLAPLWSARRLTLGRRALLAGLRAAATAALVLAVAGLSRVTVEQHSEPRPLMVIVDGSASMGVRADGRTRLTAIADELADVEDLIEAGDLEICFAADEVRRLDRVSEMPAPDGLTSDYLAALAGCLELTRPSAVLLAGDGADRAVLASTVDRDGDVGEVLAGIPFAIHTLAVGEALAGDLAVTIGDLAPFAFVRRPVDVPVLLRSQPGVEGEVSVSLREEGQLVASQTVTLPDGGGEQSLTLRVLPQDVGYVTVEVRVPVPVDDPLPGNNVDAVTLRIIRDRTRVLQLASHPSWDVRFLRRVLATDPNIDLVSFYIMRTGALPGPFRFSPLSLIEFPHEELFGEDLPGFDLVVLQNFTFGSLPSALGSADDYRANLARFVEGGGALAVVGGELSMLPWDCRGTPLGELLPFEPAQDGAVTQGDWALDLTEAGQRHPVTRLVSDEADNRRLWQTLPEVRSRNRVDRVVPDSAVLISAGADLAPLLAVREVGEGRVLALATDDSWSWAMTGAEGSGRYHADFWRDAVRWLVRDEDDHRVEVRPGRETIHVGETVQLEVRLRDDDYAARANAPFVLRVQPMGGVAGEGRALATDDQGAWTGALPLEGTGTWLLEVESAGLQGRARVTVRSDPPELDDPSPRPDHLAALSGATGGQVLTSLRSIEELADLSRTQWVITSTVPQPLWDRPTVLVLAAALLALQWWLGRRWGVR